MSDVTVEQKMRLVQQIRSRYNENRYDMYNRERILYGRAVPPAPEYEDMEGAEDMPGQVSSFRLRLILAVLLVAAVIAMDVNGIQVGEINADKVLEVIAIDYEEKIDEWAAALSR